MPRPSGEQAEALRKASEQAESMRKARALVEQTRQLHDKLGELLDEVDEYLGGTSGLAAQIKLVEHAYDELWRQRYQSPYVWRYAQDRPQIKRLIRSLGMDEVIMRASRYLLSDESFYLKTRHSFAAFVGSINAHARSPLPAPFMLEPGVVGCAHTPACRTDVEHTRRRQREVRNGGAA